MDRNRISLSMKKAVDPMEKNTPKPEVRKTRAGRPKPEKTRKPENKPAPQGSLAEALLKSGLK
jgi:hypothetical protein